MTSEFTSISRGGTLPVVPKTRKDRRQPWMSFVEVKTSRQQVGFVLIWQDNDAMRLILGLIVKEKNYLTVYVYDKWTDHSLPEFVEGEEFEPTVCEIRHGETSKPTYLTEADLVTLMDKNGIGK